jgi:CubicO group peptidase (beta-lactamase class C family)
MATFPTARRVLAGAINARVSPAAVAEVGTADGVAWREAFGSLTYEPGALPTTDHTVFDLASLTKVVATTTLAMTAVAQGTCELDHPVHRWLPSWQRPDRESVTIRDLLLHAAGLPAWRPLYETCRTAAECQAAVAIVPLEYTPRTASIYSDLGFITLAFVLEQAMGQRFDAAFDHLAGRLGLGDIRFNPPGAWNSRTAPTEFDRWRGRLLVGEVHDENAAVLGGVAGHAGLFGTIVPVGAFARLVLGALIRTPRLPPFDSGLVAEFTRRGAVPGSSRALGWDTMLPTSSCGSRMSEGAFGHTGFTGTSLWVDPDRGIYVVLLTNRVHPSRTNTAINELRPRFHDAVFADLGY